MSTTDNVLLIIITSLLGLLLAATLAVMVVFFKLLSSIKNVVNKAEDLIDSVESATEVVRDAQGRMAFFKLANNIIKLVQRSRK